MIAPLENTLKKLHYVLTHRGLREVDLLFAPFTIPRLQTLPLDMTALLHAFAAESDQDIYRWVMEDSQLGCDARENSDAESCDIESSDTHSEGSNIKGAGTGGVKVPSRHMPARYVPLMPLLKGCL